MTAPFSNPAASPEELRAEWRRLALEAHPDRGGDPAEFDRLRRLYVAALAAAEARPCVECGGTRRVRATRGFHVVQLPCPSCS